MKRNTISVALALLIITCCFASERVTAAPLQNTIHKPQGMENVDFYLITVGLGPEIYMRYGHTMIRMHDKTRGQQWDFNWGIFDFSDPMFAINFFRGIQKYRLGANGALATKRLYQDFEKRKVWKDKINLTSAQKQILTDRIFWNLQPENVVYDYQHFYNNCSTRPRDYLDEALGGRIMAEFGSKPGTQKFRDYVTKNLNRPIAAAFSLDIVMNSKIDGEITAWNEMFYPEKLRSSLLAMTTADDSSLNSASRPLLSDSEVIVDAPDYPSSSWNGFLLFSAIFGIPLTSAVAMMFASKGRLQRERGVRLFGSIMVVWGLFSGAFGMVMLMSWLFSQHQDILHNANLWILWPTDIVFAIVGWKSMLRRSISSPLRHTAKWLARGHLAMAVPYVIMATLGIFTQNVWNVIIYILPLAAIKYGIIIKYPQIFANRDADHE